MSKHSFKYEPRTEIRYNTVTGEPRHDEQHWITDGGLACAILIQDEKLLSRASLIAAAPELLEALKTLTSLELVKCSSDSELHKSIVRLIARAEGRE